MEMGWLLLKAAVLGVVEGLTEFLPISSTGHLIVAGALLNFTGSIANTFDIAIQTGAIFAILWEYRTRLMNTVRGLSDDKAAQRFSLNVTVAFLPAVVGGLLFGKYIQFHLFHPVPVAIAFIVGGLIILWVERRHRRVGRSPRVDTVEAMTLRDAVKVGLVQCLALIPGTSRSGATIIGGMCFGLSRKAATEFSFYLAIPTLIGAGVYSLYKQRHLITLADIPVFLVGGVLAFLSALLCIRWLIRYVATHDFTPFAWYRIVVGVLILLAQVLSTHV